MSTLAVYNILKESSEKWPSKPAIHDEFGTLTFLELYNQAEALREELITLGLTAGMGVGVMARNSRNFIIGIFAVVGTGAAVLPMSHQLKRDEVDELIAGTRLHAVIDDQSGIKPVAEVTQKIQLQHGFLCFSKTGISSTEIFAPHVKEPAFVRFTSGTTGKAKGVVISHTSVLERIHGANNALQLGEDDTVIWVLPMAYHFVVSIVLYIRFGSAIAISNNFLAKNILQLANAHKGTLLYASPMQIRLLAADTGTQQLNSLKTIISTSAGISTETCVAFYNRFQKNISQAYGIIEIGLPIINHDTQAENLDSVGKAVLGYEVAVFDDNLVRLSAGDSGLLGIKGPGMFDAYLNPPIQRSEILVNGFFLTADYARIDHDGTVKIEGRKKSMINISGNKVFAEEVEAVLEAIPEIEMARISGIPHRLMGQIIQAELILKPHAVIDIETILTYCRKRLSTYKIPQKVLIVDELPMTKTGKLLRH